MNFAWCKLGGCGFRGFNKSPQWEYELCLHLGLVWIGCLVFSYPSKNFAMCRNSVFFECGKPFLIEPAMRLLLPMAGFSFFQIHYPNFPFGTRAFREGSVVSVAGLLATAFQNEKASVRFPRVKYHFVCDSYGPPPVMKRSFAEEEFLVLLRGFHWKPVFADRFHFVKCLAG